MGIEKDHFSKSEYYHRYKDATEGLDKALAWKALDGGQSFTSSDRGRYDALIKQRDSAAAKKKADAAAKAKADAQRRAAAKAKAQAVKKKPAPKPSSKPQAQVKPPKNNPQVSNQQQQTVKQDNDINTTINGSN